MRNKAISTGRERHRSRIFRNGLQSGSSEIAKTRSVQQEIEATGEFDGRTVLGFLGDFGIGNGMAKGEARKKQLTG